MGQLPLVRALLVLVVMSPSAIVAQPAQSVSAAAVPRLISISGVFRPADGQPAGAVETVTLSIYADQEGGVPLWQETQTIPLDGQGRYALLLGASQADGIPAAVFASGDAQWWGLVFARAGEVEGPRVRITSVPYALRAAEADTLGGRPASDYLLAAAPGDSGSAAAVSGDAPPGVSADLVLPGTDNFLAKYVNGGADVDDSAVFETAGRVGIGTTAPLDSLHINFTNTTGAVTGLAVRNLGTTATSYSGMLFYDQNGVLGQFQGFNNGTHEYRINNIARVSQPAGAFNGAINFMIGGTSRFFVGSNGSVGIGTTSPGSLFEVSNALNALNPTQASNMLLTNYGNNCCVEYLGRKARGTGAVPAAVLNGDMLAIFGGQGYGSTRFSGTRASVAMQAWGGDWTDTSQAAALLFYTTSYGTTSPTIKMGLNPIGNLGIGTNNAQGALEVVRSGMDTEVFATSYQGEPIFMTRAARGTPAAPAATQVGDQLGVFGMGGYGATGFSNEVAGMGGFAAENWTDAAQGATLVFGATPLGTDEAQVMMALLPSGNLGVGTPAGPDDLPTALDRLQVFGDIRIGTTGTNGCVKNFGGNPIAGTCASDERFKKDITPFGRVLDRLTGLQPVHYNWRAAEFTERHFGDAQAYGLIAQDVEQVLPELVETDSDGYKAVDYSKLPLLTIQAVKDLKTENDALKRRGELEKSETEALKQRVAELERLVRVLLQPPTGKKIGAE